MEKRYSVTERVSRAILSPWATGAAIGLAVCFGLWLPKLSLGIKPLGEIYLALLQMCSLPLVICGVVASIGRVLRDGQSQRYLGRLVIVVVGGLFITAALAMALGLIVRPGSGLSTEASQTLGRLLSATEIQGGTGAPLKEVSFVDFLTSAVPKNIFLALSLGSQLPILFFSIVLGISLGVTGASRSTSALESFEATFDALLKLIEWLLYALPLGLLSLLSAQIAEAGLGIFVAMLKLILLINAAVLISLVAGNFIIARKTGRPYFTVLRQLLESLLIAFATKSSFASIPSALSAMQKLGMNRGTTDLVIPPECQPESDRQRPLLHHQRHFHRPALRRLHSAIGDGNISDRRSLGRRGRKRAAQCGRHRRDFNSPRAAGLARRFRRNFDLGDRSFPRPRDHRPERPRQLRGG